MKSEKLSRCLAIAQPIWYRAIQWLFRPLAVAFYRYRCFGCQHVPERGTLLLLSNHQSHLDPLVIGVATDRRLNFLARETLFRFAPLGWFITSVGSIPIDLDGVGLSGLKETLRRLKRGEAVVLFPEGTRTSDGEVADLLPGFCTLARRSKATLLPLAIDGAFDAWPRGRFLPRLGEIHLQFGPPIGPDEVAEYDDTELVEVVAMRIRGCHAETRRRRLGGRGWRMTKTMPK